MVTTTPARPPGVPQIDANDLRITGLRALRGPNYWRLAPVVACDVTLGALEDISSAQIPGFTERLVGLLPSLRQHPCSRARPGGFVERLAEGTHLPHILEHVALELQTLAGSDVSFGRVVPSGDEDVWWLILEYEEEEVGLQSVRDAEHLVRACIAAEPFDVRQAVERLHDLLETVRLGPSTAVIVEEARRRGIPVRRLNSGSLVQLGLGRNLRRIQAAMSDGTSAIAAEIAQDKNDTRRILENVGLPVPRGARVDSIEEALEIAQEIGFPVLLKPPAASQGRGISARLDDEAALRDAWPATAAHGPGVVVERFLAARDYRVLVVAGRVVAVAERIPAHVVGDGVHTVRQLIDGANRDPQRGAGHCRTLTHLPADDRTAAFLALRGLTFDSIPAEADIVFLRATANLSTGGTAIDRTDEIHPDNVTACEIAASSVGLDIAGIDVLSPDLSVPFRENGAMIIEVNASPGLRMHTHPREGRPRNVAAPIIEMLYPPGAEFTIPVIAITGTNGKTTTTRLIAHLFQQSGAKVGFTTTDGLYLHNRLVMEGDMTGPFSANIILSNPTVDVAVLETARGGILRAGLGFDECDVAVVLNVSADHLGLRGIHTIRQLAEVKATIPAVVKRTGHAVLNADDPLVLAMSERVPGDVVLFSARPEDDCEITDVHVAGGGIAARIEQDTFVIRRGRLRIPIASVSEVPLMLGGAAGFQRENILAAIATAYVQGVRYDTIRAGLLSFFPSPSMTPGRLNLMRVGSARVLVDYAHNIAAVEGLLDVVRNIPARRRIGVLAAPGDRRDEDIRGLGRLAAGLDRAIIKEDADLRGRPRGEVAGLLAQGMREGGMEADRIRTIFAEAEAVAAGLSELEEGDLVVILAEKVAGVLQQVRTHAEVRGLR